MAFDTDKAKQFIADTNLPSKPEIFGFDGGLPELKTTQDQALVVGSNAISFMAGVDAELRHIIMDSSLFAQLAASREVDVDTDPLKFFEAYFNNLAVIGWVIQKKESAEFTFEENTFDVHQAIIGVITTFLSPIAGAAKAVLAVLTGLRNMGRDAPFITLFNKQSRHGEIGRFQFTYIYSGPNHGLTAEVMAFSLKADNTLTQVLFFKLQKGKTSLRRSTGELSIDVDAMKSLGSQLNVKMKAYRSAYIASVDLGDH
ncbi:MAG: hypothetical protein WAK61_09735 [Leclercia sp.]